MSLSSDVKQRPDSKEWAQSINVSTDSPEEFRESLRGATGIGIEIAKTAVCTGHHAPWDIFRAIHQKRPSLALVLGGRGTGKSYLSALDTHLTSLASPGHETRVLGGSRSQSEQIYRALRSFARGWSPVGGEDPVKSLLKSEAIYRNRSEVAILAASHTSVRGPHVPSLKLDEVDEIDPDHFESAMGMCMERSGSGASVVMTSTWHRLGGPMSGLIERAQAGEFPLYSMCIFEVLETCPEERSGRFMENCPSCPIFKYCHDVPEGVTPKAKRSSGHYKIDALIQKVRTVSSRTFEADYLCKGPKADGLWFPDFDPGMHVGESAEYDPALPVHVAIDSGVFTGAVLFQLTRDATGTGDGERVHIFADYLREGATAELNARAILELTRVRCNGRFDRVSTDPAGGSRNAVGPTVIAEYERVGLRPLERWPLGSVADGLSLVESFVRPADGPPRLRIHPRCQATIRSLQSYRRAKRGGQWQDYPEDPQHPHEDLVDSLRGGLRVCFPEGRARRANIPRISARQVF
jgi:hypothetical protein